MTYFVYITTNPGRTALYTLAELSYGQLKAFVDYETDNNQSPESETKYDVK